MNFKIRFTVWCDGFDFANSIGLVPDDDSAPEISEWFFTFDNEIDADAFESFLKEKNIPYGKSHW